MADGTEYIRDKRVPGISERTNYFEHALGDYMLLLTLDFGYSMQNGKYRGVDSVGFEVIDTDQETFKKWVNLQLEKDIPHKIVNYNQQEEGLTLEKDLMEIFKDNNITTIVKQELENQDNISLSEILHNLKLSNLVTGMRDSYDNVQAWESNSLLLFTFIVIVGSGNRHEYNGIQLVQSVNPSTGEPSLEIVTTNHH